MLPTDRLTGYPHIDDPQNRGYNFLARHPFIPNMSIYKAIKMLNMGYRQIEAIDCLDLHIKYSDMFSHSDKLAGSLLSFGVKKGDIISVCMPNLYQAVVVFLASNKIGAVTTFINSGAGFDEVVEYLNLYSSPILFCFDKSEEYCQKVKQDSKVNYVVNLQKHEVGALDAITQLSGPDSILSFNSLLADSKTQANNIKVTGKDPALILYTSGSTGKPKSVVLTNENILAAGTYLKNSSRSKSLKGNRTLVCVPFTYPYGFSTSTIMTLLTNKTAILAPDMSQETITQYLRKAPNIIFGSPALLDVIMNNIPANEDISSVTTFISGGDFLTPSHYKRGLQFFEQHGAHNVEIGNGSGNAETVSCGTNPTGVEIRPETAGKVLTGTKAMIVDPETMEPKKYGEEGMLCVSGKHVFLEYYKEPELTKNAKFIYEENVYFKTGTMGSIDKDGYFTLTGRLSRFYILSTLNKVYLDHVQGILSAISFVKDCAVVKVPDNEMLYVNKAYIVLDSKVEASQSTVEQLRKQCCNSIKLPNGDVEQLLWYETPTYVEFVDNLPRREGTEKIDYAGLEEKAKIRNEREIAFIRPVIKN